MKSFLKLLALPFFVIVIITNYGCKKESEIPTLITETVSAITANTAVISGIVTDNGGTDVIFRGVCWSTSHNPTLADNKTRDGYGSGVFSSELKGLEANTQYYVRAYAVNSLGIGYGNEISFTSGKASLPTVTTATVVNITSTSAVSGGEILSNGGGTVMSWGICYSTSPDPDIFNSASYDITADGGGMGVFTAPMTELSPATVYYVRAFAGNSSGIAYGEQLSFHTAD